MNDSGGDEGCFCEVVSTLGNVSDDFKVMRENLSGRNGRLYICRFDGKYHAGRVS